MGRYYSIAEKRRKLESIGINHGWLNWRSNIVLEELHERLRSEGPEKLLECLASRDAEADASGGKNIWKGWGPATKAPERGERRHQKTAYDAARERELKAYGEIKKFTLADLNTVCGTPFLSPDDRTYLSNHNVSFAVATVRGIRTLVSLPKHRDAMRKFGFADRQIRGWPLLLAPLWNGHGLIESFQIRPTVPRRNSKGKNLKWESPTGSRKILDIPPLCLAELFNPAVPLYVTEGPIKGDWFATRGACAVTLQGVTGWRGRNEYQGLVALPAWNDIPLNDRVVIIAFDSDIYTNRMVHTAATSLAAYLSSKGASVQFLDWERTLAGLTTEAA